MSSAGERLLGYLPRFYEASPVMRGLMQSQEREADALQAAIDSVLDQQFVHTATWGLDLWERQLGLPTDPSKPADQRRSVIKSKLRGVGTVTAALIKSVAEAYDGGEVTVAEEHGAYAIKVTFIGNRGVPANLWDLENALREIIPAHLGVRFEFTFLTFGELSAAGLTFAQMDAKQLTFKQLEVWKP